MKWPTYIPVDEATPYQDFFAKSKSDQADLVWKYLFVERSPLSEAQRNIAYGFG